MIELGHYSLILAWAMALYAVAALWVGRTGRASVLASAYRAVDAGFLLVFAASAALLILLVTRDFRVEYVAAYTSRDLPLAYTITAFWGGQSGSLLLWTLLLATFSFVLAWQGRRKAEERKSIATAVVVVVQWFFLSLMLYAANPFSTVAQTPMDGRGLNPLLQNFFMIIHPPFLYVGYVAFTVPFGFAVASLVVRRPDLEWIRATRRWTMVSWLFLTAGILLGAYWAYIELGWGGYWAWDPVENASLLPWLTATAYLHSVMVQERQGMFKRWNLILMILTFELSIFGTFLTRSGIVSSVHAFADSQLGPLFLVFIGVSSLFSVWLLVSRRRETAPERSVERVASREGAFLLNNLLFVALTVAVVWGTMFPAIAEAVTGERVSITTAFFNRATWPLALATLLLSSVCPLLAWRQARLGHSGRRLVAPLVVALIAGVALFAGGMRNGLALAFFSCSSLLAAAMIADYLRGARARRSTTGESFVSAFARQVWAVKRHYGGAFVHLGVAVAFAGIIASSCFDTQHDLRLKKGEIGRAGAYLLRLIELGERRDVNKDIVFSRVSLTLDGRAVGELQPERHFHHKFEQPQTEVSIHSSWSNDVYIVLMGWEQDGTVLLRVNINPFVSLLWLGGLMIMLGAVYALLPERKGAAAVVELDTATGLASLDSGALESASGGSPSPARS
jgi:cytochrome c-type biogenesis protein CcmF